MLQTLQDIHRDQACKEKILLKMKGQEEAKAREAKIRNKQTMTLYKETIKTSRRTGCRAKPIINLLVTKESTLGLEALIDPGSSNNFVSQEVWESLPQINLVATSTPIRSMDGSLTSPLRYITLGNEVNGHVTTR